MQEDIKEQVKKQILEETRGMRIANRMVPVSGERMDIPCEGRMVNVVYYRAAAKNAPLFISFHGGGYLFGGNALDDAQWAYMRDYLDVNVASVEYRKSPEYRWREALADAYEVSCYFAAHAADFGFDKTRICAYGASAGANLAATLCLYAKDHGGVNFYRQIFMYPFLDCATDPDAKGEGSLGGPIMHIFNELHCDPDEAENPYVSPVFAGREELQGLPGAIFVMADQDNLKHEGYRYARQLAQAGVWTCVTSGVGMPHGFVESAFADVDSSQFDFMGPEVKALHRSGAIRRAAEEAYAFVKRYM